jgi:membrane protease YdiL (CAAX protease family)
VGLVTGRLVAWISFIAFFSAISYSNNFLVEGDSDSEPLYHWGFFVSGLIGFAIMIGVALLIAIGLAKREIFALRAPHSWKRGIGIGIAVLVAVFVLSAIVSIFLDPGGEQGLLPDRWPPPDWLVFGLNAATVVIGAPVAEELLFRGLGYTLLEPFGARVAIGGSALAWALAHGLLQAFPLIFALGLGLGFLRRRTGSTVPGMLLHATFNGIALLAAAAEAGS